MTQFETSPYYFGNDITSEDKEFYLDEYVETDTLCLVNYFKHQVIVIQHKDLLNEYYDINKIMNIFWKNPQDVIVEENLAENLDYCFEGMDVIFM